MSSSLLPAYFTTTNLKNKKSSGKVSSKHDQWLRSQGLHPDQIKAKKTVDKNWKKQYNESMKVDRTGYVSAGMSGNASSTASRSIMNNLHKESASTRKSILEKAARTAPAYNKGGYQYITDGADLSDVGKKK
jgi:hypothetical protein